MSDEQLEPQETPKPNEEQSQQPFNQTDKQFPPSNGGFQGGGFGFGMQQSLPNATAVLVLGILSIVLCCCYGVIGIILGIIALVLSRKGKDLYFANPNFYTESSYKNMTAGKICAIIGLVLSILSAIYYIVIFYLVSTGKLSDPKSIEQIFKGLQ